MPATGVAVGRVYGFLDNARLQAHLLARLATMRWHAQPARAVEHSAQASTVTLGDGATLSARRRH